MEGTNALIDTLVQTKSLEQVLSPISSKLSQLIIQNEAFEKGDAEAFPPDLTPSAMDVMKSSERLVEAGIGLCSTSGDQDLQRHMPGACESLSVAGQIMVTATQRLQLEEFSQEARTHLIQSAKTLLEATLKVLLVSDDAEVRRITKTGQVVLQRLAVMTSVKDMKQLVITFKSVTDSVMLFANMADKRQLDLTSHNQKDAVVTAVAVLRRSVPLLSSAMQTFVKFPENSQAVSSKEYAIGQMVESVNDVISAVKNKQSLRTLDEVEEPGQFVTTIQQILCRLLGDAIFDLPSLGGEFDQLMDEAVRHSMTVAHLSEEGQRNQVIQCCHQVLKERGQLCGLLQSLHVDSELTEAPRELQEICDVLTTTVQELEMSIHNAVLHLMIDTFKESSEPLERFVKAAMSLCKTGEEESADGQSLLQAYIDAFHTHSDAVCQVARFVASGCHISNKVRGLRCCVNQLERLDPEIVPAVLGCRLSDPASMEHLRMLKQEWLANIDLLIDSVDEVTDLKQFVQTSEHKLRGVSESCRDSIYLEVEDLTALTRRLVGVARRIAIVSQKQVDRSDCLNQRKLVMPYIHHLKKVVKATRSAASRLLGDTGELRYHETLHSRCDLLMKSVVKVRQVLEGRGETVNEDILEEWNKCEKDSADLCTEDGNRENLEEWEELGENGEMKGSNRLTASEDRVQAALKCYVADLKNDAICELSKAFVSSAVANQKERVDLLGNDLLKWTNHITEIAGNMELCIMDTQKKRTLAEVSGLLRTEMSDLLSLSTHVLDCQVEHIEQLYSKAEHWANHMSYLLSYVDRMIDKWKTVSDKVADAAKLCSVQLVKTQMALLTRHEKLILTMVDSGRRLPSASVTLSLDRSFLSRDECLELENLTSFLSTQADALASSDNAMERGAIDLTSREWAAKAFCILTSFVVTAYKSIATRKRISEVDCDNISVVRKHIENYRAETVHIKALVNELSETDSGLETLHRHLGTLDWIVESMDDTASLIGVLVSSDQVIHQLYAPYQLILLQWTWVAQVDEVCLCIDQLTGDFNSLTSQIKQPASKDGIVGGVSLLLERLREIEKYTEHSIQACQDTDSRQQVQHTLRELQSVCGHLQQETDTQESCDPLKLTILSRVWAVKCQKLVRSLKHLKAANQSTVRDVEKLCCSCPERVKHRQEDYLRQQQDGRETTKPVPSINGQKVVTMGTKPTQSTNGDQSLDMVTKQTQELKVTDTQQNSLSCSLLDYAGVLGTTLVEFDESALHSSPINRDLSLNRRDRGTPHSYTPTLTHKTPVDASWKELAKGARNQHSTPVRPSHYSGYKPATKDRTYSQGHVISPEIERWEDENNAIVRVAKETTHLVENMSLYVKGSGPLQSREELIDTAKEVASNGEKLVKFAKILVEYSTDKSRAGDLRSHCQTIPTVIAQLHILSRVKSAAGEEDNSCEVMLLRTAQSLMKAVCSMLNTAEAVCVQGLRKPPSDALDETEAVILATEWKRKLTEHRQHQNNRASKDALGLRRVTQCDGVPTLSQIM